MQAWEEKVYDRKEGKIEMVQELLMEMLEDLGTIPQELKKVILEEEDLNTLKLWHKFATKVSTIEEFESKMQTF